MTKILCAAIILSAFSFFYLVGNCYGKHETGGESGKPCSYYDTVNLTGIAPLSNGSYVYDGVVIPSSLVDYYDYEFVNRSHRAPVKNHLRGCICLLKPCINLCCPRGQTVKDENGTTMCVTVEQAINSTILVTSGTEKKAVDMNKFFVEQVHMPCEKMFIYEPEINDYDEWILFQNGTLYLNDSEKYVPRDRHCFNPHKVSPNDSTYIMNPMNCLDADPPVPKDIVYSYAMLFSIPFMILTIMVYLAIPELRNLHGLMLCCYLGCLVVGYSVLSYILSWNSQLPSRTCALIGYPAYFFFMASFFWLSVTSFDLWWNFRGIRRVSEKRRFVLYSFYVWGLSAVFLLLTCLAQESSMPDNWKPGIGGNLTCWINSNKGWAGFIYFYGPILVIILFNSTLFILTSIKIYKEMAREDKQKHLHKEKDNVWLFLRMFVVMGVSWLMEVISYMAGENYATYFYVTDIFNAILGFIIFALFVLRTEVRNLILKKYGSGSIKTSNSFSSAPTNIVLTHYTKDSLDKPLVNNNDLP